jgi:hypothetical protein
MSGVGITFDRRCGTILPPPVGESLDRSISDFATFKRAWSEKNDRGLIAERAAKGQSRREKP